jgi:hypothetical protein
MKPMTDPNCVERYVQLVNEMLLSKETYERDFDLSWLRHQGWIVVPVKSEYGHFSPQEIERIVPVLNSAGYTQCVAVATEFLDPLPTCYQLSISQEDFRTFCQKCALLAYLLMDEDRSWAISCYGAYKLIAGPQRMVEALLGTVISSARAEFKGFARMLDAGLTRTPYTIMASRYAGA